eukprot:755375-Hanusia_phi.AAC.1
MNVVAEEITSMPTGVFTTTAFPVSVCGDGIVAWDEECDDGNTLPFDGCNSTCLVERLWTCSNRNSSAKSICLLKLSPGFTSVQLFSNTTYTSSYCEYKIMILTNFYLKPFTQISVTGIPLSSNGSSVLVQGSYISENASWDPSTKTIILTVTNLSNTYLLFSTTSKSPASPQNQFKIDVSCSFCIVDLPDRPVPPFSSTSFLSFKDLPLQACPGSKFGPGCAYDCKGIIVGDKCDCPTGTFGFQCDQRATRNSKESPPPQLAQPLTETRITSDAGIGVKIPSGAIKGQGVVVSVAVYDTVELDLGPQKASITPAGPAVVFEPSGIFFETEVEIFTLFDPSSIPAGKVPCVYYNNKSAFPPWQRQDSSVVPGKNLTRALVKHFSGYMTMGTDPPSPPSTFPGSYFIVGTSPPPSDTLQRSRGSTMTFALVGGGVAIFVLVSVLFVCCRYRRRKHELSQEVVIEQNAHSEFVLSV